ncbi:MAG: spore cortex-lytic protein [Faecousia sp.]
MAEGGYLTVRTYTSSAQLPVVGATVSVTEQGTNGAKLIATRITDWSGRTTPIPISTPNRSESLTPGQAVPFTKVNITIEKVGFDRVLIENAQLFAGITSELNVEMLPLGENPDSFNTTELVDVTPQEL